MTKIFSRGVFALASLSVVMLSYSCTFGLESLSSSRNDATVSISIPAPLSGRAGDESRAVAPDASYLYIRAIGGPAGAGAKSCLGPYATAPGTTFKTKDIEPGSYDGFLLLMTTSPIDNAACVANGATTTFGAVLSLPDEAFRSAIATDSSSGLTIFDASLGNTASFAVLGATVIKEGKGNSLAATLKPATSATMAATEGGTLKADGSGTYRSFVRITALKARANASGAVKGKIANPGEASASLASFAAYRADGSLIPGSAVSSTVIAGGKSDDFTIAAAGEDSCFVYLGFVAPSLTLEFVTPATETPVAPPTGKTMTVAFSGSSAHMNQRALFEVYAASGVKYDEGSNDYEITGAPIAFGAATLDSSGAGSGVAYDMSTGEPKAFDAGTYYVSAFVDMNGTYDDVIDIPNSEVIGNVIPNRNDSVPVKKAYACLVATTAVTHTFDSGSFVTYTDDVLFVGASDAGDGSRKDRQESLENAIAAINSATSGATYIVYVKDPVSTATAMTVPGGVWLTLMSADSSPKTITYTGTSSSFITEQSAATLYLKNCVIDGNSLSRGFSLLDISGTLIMETGSGIQYANSTGVGGVYMKAGSTFNMRGGTIQYCQGNMGGGIYMYSSTAPAVFTMTGGEILNCSATASGGGIYVATGIQTSSILIKNAAITACGALNGAGVYLGSKASMELLTGGIVDQSQLSANGKGGGVYVGTNATLTLDGGTISGSTAGTSTEGGGVYVAGNGNLVIPLGTGGDITDCEATTGGGLYVATGGLLNGATADVTMLDENFELQLLETVHDNNTTPEYVLVDYP